MRALLQLERGNSDERIQEKVRQTNQFLYKILNGYKSDIKNGSIQKLVGEHFKIVESPVAS